MQETHKTQVQRACSSAERVAKAIRAPYMQETHKTQVQRACSSAERVAKAIRAASRRLYTDSPILPSAAPNCASHNQSEEAVNLYHYA